jgi:hypothetical protein
LRLFIQAKSADRSRRGSGSSSFGPLSRPYSPKCVEGEFYESELVGLLLANRVQLGGPILLNETGVQA